MRVKVLGPLAVDTSNGPLSPRDRVVLSVLVLHGTQVVSADRLADALWGDNPPASSSKVIQGCIVRLRKGLGQASIETHAAGYRLALGADDVDLHRFERLIGRARELLALQAPDRALRAAEEALTLWRGRPFDDVDGWDAARFEAARLEELRQEGEELRVDAALRSGRHHEILAVARGLVDAAPTRERRWELLALAQYRSGSQADALRTLHEARRRLADELGLDPGSGILHLEAAILRQDDDLLSPTIAPVVDDACPWPGLLSYSVDDTDGFAGRDAESGECLDRLATHGVLVVVGPSGSGKSSLVRAGVAGQLARDGRRVVILTPGSRPLDTLNRRMPLDGCVLVVDQCEEAATACDDAAQRDGFFDALATHAERAPLVVALRADRLGDFSGHPAFARLVERGLFLLGPMDEPALRAAIERPAGAAGLLLEPGLVDLVVRDVLDEPGALPLMSHALQQTWARRDGRTLTVAGYTETGGIRSAVAQSAETVYSGVGVDDQPKLRDLLLRLVIPVEDGAPARARLLRTAVASDPGYQRLIDQLVDARLLTTDGDFVELAHEALARAWPRFKDWLEEDVEGYRVLRHLNSAAAGWDALGRPDSELYRGERLAGVVAWRERSGPELTTIEEAFVAASVERQREELRAAEVQVEREQRTVRRLRRLVSGVALLAVTALVAGAVALVQRNAADEQARVAEARRISAEALDARPHDRALLLALEAVRRWEDPESLGSLLTTIGRSPQVAGVLRSDGPGLPEIDLAPSGERIVARDSSDDVSIYDLATKEEVGALEENGTMFRSPVYSPNGRALAVARMDDDEFCGFSDCHSSVDVYDAAHLDQPPTSYEMPNDLPLRVVAWSPDGKYLAAAAPHLLVSDRRSVLVWRVGEPGEPMHRLAVRFRGIDLRSVPDDFPPAWLAFSADGRTLYASGAGPITAFDVESGDILGTIDCLGGLAVSPDGTTLAVASASHAVRLVDTASGAAVTELAGHDDVVMAAAFSQDGSLIATAGIDQTVAVWDTATGNRLHLLEGHAGGITDLTFNASATRLFSSATDRTVFEWDLTETTGPTRTVAGPTLDLSTESTVLVSPTGDFIAVLDVLAERVQLVDVDDGRVLDVEVENNTTVWGAFSPDSQLFVGVDFYGTTRSWRTSDGEVVAVNFGRQNNNGAIAFSSDGRSVLVADVDGVIVELEAETLEPTGRKVKVDLGESPISIHTTAGGRFAVTSGPSDGTDIAFGSFPDNRIERVVHVDSEDIRANFSADGTRYAYGGHDGRVGVVDVETGEVRSTGDPVHSGPVAWVALSPEGSTLASMGFDGFLTLADGATARPRAGLFPGPVNRNGAMTYTPDGHTVALAYADGRVLAFDTDPAAWVAHACEVAGRDLTADEWRDAFGDEPHRSTCS